MSIPLAQRQAALTIAFAVSAGIACLAAWFGSPRATVGAAHQLPESRASLSFAGGAVQFDYSPEHWIPSELAAGRQILLVLSRARVAFQNPRDLEKGIWFAYQHGPSADRSEHAMRQRLATRLHWATGHEIVDSRITPTVVDGWPGLVAEYELAKPSNRKIKTRKRTSVGGHYVVALETGWLDIHWVAPSEEQEQIRAGVVELLQKVKLDQPRLETTAGLDPEAPLGLWKSQLALLKFSSDGQVSLQFDRPASYSLDQLGRLDYEQREARLVGEFVREGQRLQVTWNDGSTLVWNWRTEPGQLFLTDHHGRVSQLWRVFP